MASASTSVWEPVKLSHGLSLVPRLRIFLTFTPSDLSIKPLDEWQLKESLKSLIKDAFPFPLPIPDLSVSRYKDPSKNRRGDPVASGVLRIWDLQALCGDGWGDKEGFVGAASQSGEAKLRRRTLLLVERLSGVEINMGGLKLRCQARVDEVDDFLAVKRSWQDVYGRIQTGYQMQTIDYPDTLILRNIPSRWFAEPRVSSKASVLVTHTIFSLFGAIRNLDVKEDDLGKVAQGFGNDISMAFSCHVWVQYEQYSGFCNAMRAFCGRSMLREGSSFKANYELSWDKDGYFTEGNIRKRKFDKEKVEEQRRRQILLETRQAEIAVRQAELARLEHEKKEREHRQQLREEEEKRRQEEQEKMLRQIEVECMIEEELAQRKKMEEIETKKRERKLQREEELRQREEKMIKGHAEEARQRAEQQRQLEDGKLQQKLDAEKSKALLKERHRRIEEEAHHRIKDSNSREEELQKPQHGHRITGKEPVDEGSQYQESGRWDLRDTPALTSLHRVADADDEGDNTVAFMQSRKRLKSIIVDSRNVFLV